MNKILIKLPDLKVAAEKEPEPKQAWIIRAGKVIVPLAFLVVGIHLFWTGLDLIPTWVRGLLNIVVGTSLVYRAIDRWSKK